MYSEKVFHCSQEESKNREMMLFPMKKEQTIQAEMQRKMWVRKRFRKMLRRMNRGRMW